MKNFRILLILVMLISTPSMDTNAQILSKILRKSAKTAVKKTGKEISQDMARKVIAKELGQAAAKKSTKNIFKESAEAISKRTIKSTLNNSFGDVLMVGLVRNIDDVAIKSGLKVGAQTSKEVAQRLTCKQVNTMASETAQQHFKKVLTKRVVKEVGEKAARTQLTELVGERAAKEWCEKIAKENFEEKSKMLIADLASNKQLRELIERNPNILKAYHRCIGAKAFRGDVSMLKYLDNGAGKFYQKGFGSIDKFGNGSNLVLRDVRGGVAEVVDGKTGQLFGRMQKDAAGRYLIEVPENGNRTLLNLAPKTNAVYVSGSNKWYVNSYGQVYKAEYCVYPNATNVKALRNGNIDTPMGTHKNLFNTSGKLAHSDSKFMPQDDAGHIIARTHGGTNDFVNYVPQNSSVNQKGIWRAAENAVVRSSKNGETVKCVVEMKYPNTTTLRPSSFARTHTIDGKYQKIKYNGKEYILDGKMTIENKLEYSNTLRERVNVPLSAAA